MICAVIITRDHPPALARLLGVLASDSICTHLIVAPRGSERGLHELWNEACDAADAHGAMFIAVLSDDVAIVPGTLSLFASVLAADLRLGVVHPDSAALGWSLPTDTPLVDLERPVTGACFMLRASTGVRFDEPMQFDEQFDRDVRAAGWTVGCVLGVPYRRASESTATPSQDAVWAAVDDDAPRLSRTGASAGG
jgi:hypothetical protein